MYYIIYGTLYLLSLLPFSILYFLSDIIYLIVYYLLRYRREIVSANLKIAFPEKSEKERSSIVKKFYQNLVDTFVESIKFLSISKKQILKYSTGDFDVINQLIAKGYNVHIMVGHQFNWEYANLLYAMHLSKPFVGIYIPISNKILDRIFLNIRKKYGTIMIPAPDFRAKKHEVFSKQYILALAADQNPGDPANAYWMNFFGKPAPFVTGPAKGAVKNNTSVVIVAFNKLKRGHYHFSTTLLAENSSSHTPRQLTALYKKALEEIIRKDPSNYLWSHRRWKWNWKEEYGEAGE
jgi:KDO2-lipid IV(A) lauroyltransferase